jgi:hypothetical protein
MWVFCCGMQRSGSTLQFQIAACLVERAGLGRRVEWVEPGRFPELRDRYADVPGLKVFKHHICTDAMAAEFARGNAVGIYSYRDPRDVFVSNMKKYSTSFEELWCSGFLEMSLWNYRRWTGQPRVLVSRYETMIGDLAGEVARIAAHLQIALDAQDCRRIADEHSMPKQLERIAGFGGEKALRDGYAGARYDPESMLHTDHIQGGVVGGWRGVLRPGERALIENMAADWLRAHGYELTLGTWQRRALALREKVARRARRLLRRRRAPAQQRAGNG